MLPVAVLQTLILSNVADGTLRTNVLWSKLGESANANLRKSAILPRLCGDFAFAAEMLFQRACIRAIDKE